MPSANQCPTCQAELPADAPAGLCPACLLKAGMTSDHVEAGTRTNRNTFVPPTPAELAPHFPQLEILDLVGQGGMGAVYKAKQVRLDRIVALKVLPKDAEKGQEFADRFTREAKAMARLSHPNIIAIHDYGEAGGWYFFVMEFVDGVNLRQAMRASAIPPDQALVVVGQICDALQYAHEENVVHRDIKPENILLTQKGRVKIADFGLAKLLGLSGVDRHLTATQQVMGTIGYMAPEQMEGSKSIDHRADIYALGVVFYELLTGELPMGRFAPPSQKVQVDVRIDEVVLKSLEREPSRRYQSASQVKYEVERISTAPAANLSTPTPIEQLNWLSKRLTLVGTGLLTIGIIELAAGLASIFSFMDLQARREFLRDASAPTVQMGYSLVWTDFLALSWLVLAAGLLTIFRRVRGLAIVGAFAAMAPMATVGAMIVPNRAELMRDFNFIQWLGVVSIPVGIWALVELIRPETKALFRWPVLPALAATWRFLVPRFLNSTLLTLLAVGTTMTAICDGPWSSQMYLTATNHGPLAVSIIVALSLFLVATWPYGLRPVLWRPVVTFIGGLVLFAIAYDYYCNRRYGQSGNRGLFLDFGWQALLFAAGFFCLNGAWRFSRWLVAEGDTRTLASRQPEDTAVPKRSWNIESWGIALCVLSCVLFWPFYNEPLRTLGFEPRFVMMSREYWIMMLLPSIVTGLVLIIAGPKLRNSTQLGLVMLVGGILQLVVTLWIVPDAPTYLNSWLMLVLGAALGLLGAWRLRTCVNPGAATVSVPSAPVTSMRQRRRWAEWSLALLGVVAAMAASAWLALTMGWVEWTKGLTMVQHGEFIAHNDTQGQCNFVKPFELAPTLNLDSASSEWVRVESVTADGFQWKRSSGTFATPLKVTWTARGEQESTIKKYHRQLLLGTWKQIDGNDVVTFQSDGTFTETSDTGVSNGIYRWLAASHLFIHDPAKQPREIRVQVDNETLTVRPDSGPIVRFQRVN